MACKSLPVSRIQRWVKRRLLHCDFGGMKEIFGDLNRSANSGVSVLAMMEKLDAARIPLYNRFLKASSSDYYSKIMTLKVLNLVAAKYHFLNRHIALSSYPTQFHLDPSNTCQLHCPGCVHTSNPERRAMFDWPNGNMRESTFYAFIRHFGPFALYGTFFNYGEPLLNRRTADFIRVARTYLMTVSVSSNLSMKIDAESLVRSGLDYLMVSLDGASEDSYTKYRRGGNFGMALDNIRQIVDAKKRFGKATPRVVWQFLTFEHNVHEVDLVFETARSLGVDELVIAEPFPVTWDDPEIRCVRSPRNGRRLFARVQHPTFDRSALPKADPILDRLFNASWVERAKKVNARSQKSGAPGETCAWLYNNITIDAHGRVMPCCAAPGEARNLVYGQLGEEEVVDPGHIFNAAHFTGSRLAFSDRDSYSWPHSSRPPRCATCDEYPGLPLHGPTASEILRSLDEERVIGRKAARSLTDWIEDSRAPT
jgi:MoaA/NifB/PqqE/SkfB family radical SAM enzyme